MKWLLNWNPHSLLQINPNPTPLPSTQLTLVYNTYVYPPREEERDSKMGGFKLGVFYREARINRSTGELLLYDWSNTKSRLDPDSWFRGRTGSWVSATNHCFAGARGWKDSYVSFTNDPSSTSAREP